MRSPERTLPAFILMFSLLMLASCTQTEHTTVTTNEDGSSTVVKEREVRTDTTTTNEKVSFDEVKDKSKAAWEATAAYLTQERDKMSGEIQQTAQAIDQRLADLRDRSDKATGQEKADINREISGLEVDRAKLDEWKNKAGQATQSAWTQLKAGWKKTQSEINQRLKENQQATEQSER